MILQLLIDQLESKYYPVALKGRYRAKVCSFDYHDTAGNTKHFVIRVQSNTFRVVNGTYSSSLIFSNVPEHGHVYDAPLLDIEAYGAIDLELSMVAGTGIGTLSFAILTLDLEPLDE